MTEVVAPELNATTEGQRPPRQREPRPERPPVSERIADPRIAAAIEELPERVRPIAEAEYEALRTRGDGGAGVAEARRQLALATGEREAREAAARQQRQELEAYRSRRIELPDFVPTQENAMSIGTLFGLLGVVGTMMGGRGQQSAVGAMNAMSGMLSGWRQGRADVYNRERQQFDVQLRRVQEQNNILQRDFQEAMNLMRTDLDAGLARAREVAARHGIPIASAAAARQGAEGVRNFLQGLRSTMMQLEQTQGRAGNQAPIARADRDERGEVRYYAANARTGDFLLDSNGQRVEMAPPRGAGAVGGVGAIQFRYNVAVSNAVSQAALELENIAGIPALAAPPVLNNYIADPNKTVTEGLLRFMGQRMTTTEQRATQQILAGVTRAITTIQASGRPGGVTESSLREFARMAPQPGDSRLNYYLFLALAKQELDLGLIELRNAGATREQIESAQRSRDKVNELIRWNVADINRIMVGPGGRPLVNERAIELLQHSGSIREAERGFARAARERSGQTQAGTPIPPAAIEALRADPSPTRRQQFDEIFGAGAAERTLGAR